MLGPLKPHHLDEPVVASLEALVPADHVSRHLESTLDLGFVHDLVTDADADRGRPGVDPVVFCKLQVGMFVAGIRSERHLMRLAGWPPTA